MAATNDQQSALAEASGFQAQVRASIMKKAIAIIEDVAQNGVIGAPLSGKTADYTNAAYLRAKSICGGQGLGPYYLALAGSTNVVASNVTYDFKNRSVVSDISDAGLDGQVFVIVFQDLA